jgi:hypothetical protein
MRMENAGRHAESKKTRAIDSPKRPIKNRNNSFGNWSWNGRLSEMFAASGVKIVAVDI